MLIHKYTIIIYYYLTSNVYKHTVNMSLYRIAMLLLCLLTIAGYTLAFRNGTTGCGDLQDDEFCKPIKMALGLDHVASAEDIVFVEDVSEPVKPKNVVLDCDGDLEAKKDQKKKRFTGRTLKPKTSVEDDDEE